LSKPFRMRKIRYVYDTKDFYRGSSAHGVEKAARFCYCIWLEPIYLAEMTQDL
jgi:hypothetical protein